MESRFLIRVWSLGEDSWRTAQGKRRLSNSNWGCNRLARNSSGSFMSLRQSSRDCVSSIDTVCGKWIYTYDCFILEIPTLWLMGREEGVALGTPIGDHHWTEGREANLRHKSEQVGTVKHPSTSLSIERQTSRSPNWTGKIHNKTPHRGIRRLPAIKKREPTKQVHPFYNYISSPSESNDPKGSSSNRSWTTSI